MRLLGGGQSRYRSLFEILKTTLQLLACTLATSVSVTGNFICEENERSRTVISLGDAVLNSTTLGKIRDLRPVFVGIGIDAERAAEGMVGGQPRARRWLSAVTVLALHGRCLDD